MWRFVQISDPHLASTRDGEWNNRFLCSMMPDVMACLKKDLAALAPDFILATGDIVSAQSEAASMAARDAMESLGIPYYPMGGNHDFVVEASRRWFIDAYKHRLPQARTHYTFQHRNLRFVVLDPWWLWRDGTLHPVSEASVAANLEKTLAGARWALPPQQLEWLAETLEIGKETPTILSLHYPLLPIPARLLRADTRNGGFLENGALVLEMLKRYPQVKAVFSGHVHLHFIARADTVTQVTTAALPEYPCEYREVQVFDDRLEVFTHPLSDPSFAQRSLLPGKEYTRGEEQDRRATIPL